MKDFFLALASLMIAVVLWLQIQPQADPGREREMTVRLEVENLSTGLAIIQVPESVRIIVSGTTQVLEGLDSSEFSAFVDMAESGVGEITTLVQVKGPTRQNLSARPVRPRLTLNVDRILRTNKEVTLETTGLPPIGLTYDISALDPDEIEISGPTKLVQRVATLRALLDLSKVRPGSAFTLNVEPLDSSGKPVTGLTLEPDEVTATPSVISAPTSKRVLVNPIFSGQLPFGASVERFEVTPNQVEVTGPSTELARISQISTAVIPLDGMTGTVEKEIDLTVPQGVRISGSGKVKVVLVVRQSQTTAPPPANP